MSTGWPIEARLSLVEELIMAIGENPRLRSSNPQASAYTLVKCIVRDSTFKCTNSTVLVQVLKKTPIWEKAKLFLENVDRRCGRKGCNHDSYSHRASNTNACKASQCRLIDGKYTYTPCTCKQFTQKKF